MTKLTKFRNFWILFWAFLPFGFLTAIRMANAVNDTIEKFTPLDDDVINGTMVHESESPKIAGLLPAPKE